MALTSLLPTWLPTREPSRQGRGYYLRITIRGWFVTQLASPKESLLTTSTQDGYTTTGVSLPCRLACGGYATYRPGRQRAANQIGTYRAIPPGTSTQL
eukprot:1790911-Amphidinium_carterae.1